MRIVKAFNAKWNLTQVGYLLKRREQIFALGRFILYLTILGMRIFLGEC